MCAAPLPKGSVVNRRYCSRGVPDCVELFASLGGSQPEFSRVAGSQSMTMEAEYLAIRG